MVDVEGKIKRIRERLPELFDRLDPCRLCPRNCAAARRHGEVGECGIEDQLVVSSIGLHHGNEYPISGYQGSGNIFLTGCSLHCVYCQNWDVSQARHGRKMSAAEVAQAMLNLQAVGAHNINPVTPTHMVPMLLEALLLASEKGLKLPLTYNTSGYDALEVIELLDGIVDIYLPDMKYADAENGLRFSTVQDYPMHNQAAVREMHRQVGPLEFDENGVAVHGLLVRHLVLPGDLGGSEKIFTFLDEELPGPVYVNVMAQYRPCYKAGEFGELARRITQSEFEEAVQRAREKKTLRLIER